MQTATYYAGNELPEPIQAELEHQVDRGVFLSERPLHYDHWETIDLDDYDWTIRSYRAIARKFESRADDKWTVGGMTWCNLTGKHAAAFDQKLFKNCEVRRFESLLQAVEDAAKRVAIEHEHEALYRARNDDGILVALF